MYSRSVLDFAVAGFFSQFDVECLDATQYIPFVPLRNLGREPLTPVGAMNQKNDEPNDEGDCAPGDGHEHQPAHYTKGIKQLPIVFSVDHTGMHRAFIHAAAVRIGD